MTSLKDMIIDKFLIVKNKQTNEMDSHPWGESFLPAT